MSRECPRPRDGGQRDDQRQAPAEPRLPRAVTPVLLPARAVLHVDVVRAGPVDAVPRQQIFFIFRKYFFKVNIHLNFNIFLQMKAEHHFALHYFQFTFAIL